MIHIKYRKQNKIPRKETRPSRDSARAPRDAQRPPNGSSCVENHRWTRCSISYDQPTSEKTLLCTEAFRQQKGKGWLVVICHNIQPECGCYKKNTYCKAWFVLIIHLIDREKGACGHCKEREGQEEVACGRYENESKTCKVWLVLIFYQYSPAKATAATINSKSVNGPIN